MIPMNKEQLIEIEIKLAYHEKMISELNTIVFDQQKTIDHLLKMLDFFRNRISELSNTLTITESVNEKPPHY